MKLLLIMPHPDDEVYGAAGTIMEFEEQNLPCGLITLTRGDAGRNLGLCNTPEELAEIREQELKNCLDILGISFFKQYTFPDKKLKDIDQKQLIDIALEAIEEQKPEIVLTFPPNGMNGHPDHITVSKIVQEAIKRSKYKPRLWYYANDLPPENTALLPNWKKANIHRDINKYLNKKLRAIACHRSQALSTVDFIRFYADRITLEAFYEEELN